MRNVFIFLLFLIYATAIFFLPNNSIILVFFILNLLIMFLVKTSFIKAIKNLFKLFPFILFTFLFNYLFDSFQNAFWIGIKLLLVCNITFIYSTTITITRFCKNNTITLFSLKDFEN